MGIKQSLGNLLRGAEQKSVGTGDLINSTLTVNQQTTLQVFFVDGKRLDAALFEQATQLGLTPLLTDFYTQHQHIADQLTAIDTKMTELQDANQTKDATIASQQQTINDQNKALIELAIQKGQLKEQEINFDQDIPHKVQARIGVVITSGAVADTPDFQQLLQLIRANKLLDAQSLSQQIQQQQQWQKWERDTLTNQIRMGKEIAALTAPFYLGEKYSDAVAGYERAIGIYPDQPEALTNLADAYTKLPKPEYQKARLRYDQAIALYEALVNLDKPNKIALANAYGNIGNVWQTLGEAKTSIRYLNKALALFLELEGNQHLSVASIYNNLGISYRNLGDLEQAIDWYKKSAYIKKAVYGEQHASVATTYNNLGVAYRHLGDLKQAIVWYKKSVAIKKAVYGEQHQEVASIYNNLGIVYRNLRDMNQAITYYKRSVAIKQALYGEQNLEMASIYNNLGFVHHTINNDAMAKEYYLKAKAIFDGMLPEGHPSREITDENLRDIGIDPASITAEQLQQALNSPLPSIGASD